MAKCLCIFLNITSYISIYWFDLKKNAFYLSKSGIYRIKIQKNPLFILFTGKNQLFNLELRIDIKNGQSLAL